MFSTTGFGFNTITDERRKWEDYRLWNVYEVKTEYKLWIIRIYIPSTKKKKIWPKLSLSANIRLILFRFNVKWYIIIVRFAFFRIDHSSPFISPVLYLLLMFMRCFPTKYDIATLFVAKYTQTGKRTLAKGIMENLSK